MKKRPGGPLTHSIGPLSKSVLFPVLSDGLELIQKAYLGPVIVTIIFVVAAFGTIGEPEIFNLLLAGYLIGAGYYFIYRLCGKHKPWWLVVGVMLATILVLVSPLLPMFIFIFRGLLPGARVGEEPTSFVALLVGHFFGAGLMEELLKALPILGAYWLGHCLQSPRREQVGIWEPLDGIVLGAASAAGFTLLETLGQYVPGITQGVARQYGQGAGYLLGLQVLIPRIIGALAGHMAYSGYLGYFIGLSVLKPARRWQILGTGYLTAAGLHALWNASSALGNGFTVVAGSVAYIFLAAAILKARQLSPTRVQNFATQVLRSPLRAVSAQFVLHVGGRAIALYPGTKMRVQDIPGIQAWQGDGIAAEVVPHPQDPRVLGLKNLSQRAWVATLAQGGQRQVEGGRSIRLEAGTKIHFGTVEGEVQ